MGSSLPNWSILTFFTLSLIRSRRLEEDDDDDEEDEEDDDDDDDDDNDTGSFAFLGADVSGCTDGGMAAGGSAADGVGILSGLTRPLVLVVARVTSDDEDDEDDVERAARRRSCKADFNPLIGSLRFFSSARSFATVNFITSTIALSTYKYCVINYICVACGRKRLLTREICNLEIRNRGKGQYIIQAIYIIA